MTDEQHNDETTVAQPPHSTTPEVERLVQALERFEPLAIVTDGQIADITGESLTSRRFQSIIQRALRRLRTEKAIVYTRVRKTGYQRQDSHGIIDRSRKSVPKVRRTAIRERKVLLCANPEELDQQERVQYVLTSSTLGVIAAVTTPKFLGKLEVKCVDAANQIKPGSVMELFLKIGEPSKN
jgi:hypothetical protein